MSKAPLYTVTIEAFGPSDFDIKHNGMVCDRLNWDEMLGSIAEITHPKIGTGRYQWQPENEPRRWPREEDEIAAGEGEQGEAAA